MVATAEMAMKKKPKGRPRKSERNDRTAKIDATVLGLVEMVAKARGITVAEYLTEAVKSVVAKDYAKVMKQLEEGNLP